MKRARLPAGRARIAYLRKAQQDLLDIFDYIRADNPSAAVRLLDQFDASIGRLASFPGSGVRPRDQGLRARGYRLLIVDDYLVFYLLKGRTIEIRRVIHGRRRYDFLVA